MADRQHQRDDPSRGEPTPRRNFRDQFEGSGDYGGSYSAGGAAGRGYGGGYAGYDEERDEAPGALRTFPRPDVPRPGMIVGLGGNTAGYGRGGALDYGYGGMNVGGRDADWGLADVPRGGASLTGSRLGEDRAWRPDFTGRGPRGYKRSDIRINEDVCDALTQDRLVDASDIDVRVEAGEVTLSGNVQSRLMKRRAEDVAEFVRGVRDIHNRLRIDPGARAADREVTRDVELEGGSPADVMRPGGAAEAYTRAQGTEPNESDGS
ncbi:MAG TPA: BON domain-containing protein [Gemmatimonadaceae bacterium]|nr:BON domain-containing protein [Gemmatimonadaceae bacterium]